RYTSPLVISTLSLHDALPIYGLQESAAGVWRMLNVVIVGAGKGGTSLLNALLKMSRQVRVLGVADRRPDAPGLGLAAAHGIPTTDRKSTRLHSSHVKTSYAVL